MPGSQTLDAQSQDDGDDGGQALRDGGHGQGDGDEEHGQEGFALKQAHSEKDGADAQAEEGELFGDLHHFPLHGGVHFLLPQEQGGDLAHLRVHACGGDHGGGSSGGDDRGGDDQIGAVAQGGVFGEGGVGVLGDGQGLAGDGGLVRFQASAVQQSGVGRHQVTGFQLDQVAGHQLGGVHAAELVVADDPRLRGAHLPEGVQSPLGAGLLGEGDAGVDQDDDQDDDRIQPVPASAGDEGEGGGGQQNQHHGVLDLVQEAERPGGLGGLLELVEAVVLEPLSGVGRGEAGYRVGTQLLQHLSGGKGVPGMHESTSL